MERRHNPYAPGAGLQPPELAGRDSLLQDAATDMDRLLDRRPTKGMMLLGLRGVGKTVVLNRLHHMADEKGIQTAKIEAPEGGTLPQLLAPELRRILYGLDLRTAAGGRLRQAVSALRNFVRVFRVKIGDIEFGMEPSPGQADTGNLEQDLPQLIGAVAEAAKERESAICLFIDEVQYLSRQELAALIVAGHEMAQRNLPFLFIGAGLPQLAALAGNAKSYAERLLNYPQMGSLERAATMDALVHPAQNRGVIAHLDANFFRVRFDRLTVLQQKYLRAMGQLGTGPYKTGDIAAALGVRAADVATVRQQLIDKGMIWSQRHGETAFTVPMFDAFMKRQMPVFERHEPKRRKVERT